MNIHDLRGVTLGQYQLRELLGVGGMGAVYRAEQAALRRAVAVKVMSAKLTTEPGYVERFYREARIAAQLEHAHIIPVYDYGVQGDISYLVMRLLTGASLMDRLRQTAERDLALPALGEVSVVLDQLASALDYAHSQGVIHRDIKPNNVMFDNQGSAYLVDFGIAKLLEATSVITNSGVAMGTPLFMPPEQWRSEEISPAADQYALGVMLYLLLTGQAPFQSDTPHGLMYKHLMERPAPVQAFRADMPDAVTAVLERALAKEPAKRFPTVTALAQSFSSAIAGVDSGRTNFFIAPVRPTKPAAAVAAAPTSREAHPVTPAVPAMPHERRRGSRLVGIGTVLIVVVLAIAALLALRAQGQGQPQAGSGSVADARTLTATPPELTRTLPSAASASATAAPSTTSAPSETPAPPSSTPPPTKPPTAAPDRSATAIAQQLVALAASLTAVSWTETPAPTLPPTIPPTATMLPSATPIPTSATPTPPLTTTNNTPAPPPIATAATAAILPATQTPTPRTVALAANRMISPENAALLVERGSVHAEFPPRDLVISPDGSRLAIGGNGVAIYDCAALTLITVMGRGGPMAFSADWALLAMADDTRVVLFDPATSAEIGAIDILTTITDIALSPDGRIAIAATGKVVKVLDVATGNILKTLNVETITRVSAVAFTSDGARLVIASDAGIWLWDAQTWTETLRLSTERTSVFAMSPDGLELAAEQAGQIMVWELTTGRQLVRLNGEARSLASSPDGRLLAAGRSEPRAILLDLATRQALVTLAGHTGEISQLTFSPDGAVLFSASTDNSIKAWALPTP